MKNIIASFVLVLSLLATPFADLDQDGRNVLDEGNPRHWFESDHDHDDLHDGWEAAVGLDSSTRDSDGDGRSDLSEINLGYDPLNPDSDGDGIEDGDDCNAINAVDEDGDGITNAEEAVYGSDPCEADSDHDGIPDGDEYEVCLLSRDCTGNRIPETYEIEHGFHPSQGREITVHYLEHEVGLDPIYLENTDGDVIPDEFERTRDWGEFNPSPETMDFLAFVRFMLPAGVATEEEILGSRYVQVQLDGLEMHLKEDLGFDTVQYVVDFQEYSYPLVDFHNRSILEDPDHPYHNPYAFNPYVTFIQWSSVFYPEPLPGAMLIANAGPHSQFQPDEVRISPRTLYTPDGTDTLQLSVRILQHAFVDTPTEDIDPDFGFTAQSRSGSTYTATVDGSTYTLDLADLSQFERDGQVYDRIPWTDDMHCAHVCDDWRKGTALHYHEVLHAIGLGHTHNGYWEGESTADEPSVMSYTTPHPEHRLHPEEIQKAHWLMNNVYYLRYLLEELDLGSSFERNLFDWLPWNDYPQYLAEQFEESRFEAVATGDYPDQPHELNYEPPSTREALYAVPAATSLAAVVALLIRRKPSA